MLREARESMAESRKGKEVSRPGPHQSGLEGCSKLRIWMK